jgi:hypothetical protein
VLVFNIPMPAGRLNRSRQPKYAEKPSFQRPEWTAIQIMRAGIESTC